MTLVVAAVEGVWTTRVKSTDEELDELFWPGRGEGR